MNQSITTLPNGANGIHVSRAAQAKIDKERASQVQHQAKPRKPNFPRVKLSELAARPPVQWLIQDILLEVGTGILSADYASYKSFIVLDMALSIATGLGWQGKGVKQGKVVYIVAEGSYTVWDRALAWSIRRQVELTDEHLEIIEIPVQIGNVVECKKLVDDLKDLKPALIILDTLAKCNIGRDENDATAMGHFTQGMDTLGRELETMVLAVHHNNKSGNMRGSSAMPANVDTHIISKVSPGRTVTLACDKQKGAPFEAFTLTGHVVELPRLDEYDRPVTSLVFDAEGKPPVDAVSPDLPKAEQTRRKIMTVLHDLLPFNPAGVQTKDWQAECLKRHGVSETTFFRHRADSQDEFSVKDNRNFPQ